MNKKSYNYIFSTYWNPRSHVWECLKFTDMWRTQRDFAWLVSIGEMQRKIKITNILSLSIGKSGGNKWIELEGIFCSPWHKMRQLQEKEYKLLCTTFLVLFFHYWRATNQVGMKYIYLILIMCYLSSLTSAMVSNKHSFEEFFSAWKIFRDKGAFWNT